MPLADPKPLGTSSPELLVALSGWCSRRLTEGTGVGAIAGSWVSA